MPVEIKLLAIHEDMLEVAQLFDDAARQLRRLGTGGIRNGSDYIFSRHIYQFGGKIRIVDSFQRDICFETANRLEEYADTLKLLATRENACPDRR